jgi:hypothetical protein
VPNYRFAVHHCFIQTALLLRIWGNKWPIGKTLHIGLTSLLHNGFNGVCTELPTDFVDKYKGVLFVGVNGSPC